MPLLLVFAAGGVGGLALSSLLNNTVKIGLVAGGGYIAYQVYKGSR
ncbi:hypothetical protein [Pseudoalteromonas sp. S1609]|nr:hypothetical protein [Pseudoalteromonas sp. S1609]